jgi:uncharacterized protein Smg (DUF494 family)
MQRVRSQTILSGVICLEKISTTDMAEDTMSKQQTEIQYLKNEINQLRNDMRNLILVLIDLKILKVTTDEDGKAVYDTGTNG